MEKFKIMVYDPSTMGSSEMETPFPKEIVEKMQQTLNILSEKEDWVVTPMMFRPPNLDIIWGVIEKDEEGIKLKYSLTLSINK